MHSVTQLVLCDKLASHNTKTTLQLQYLLPNDSGERVENEGM